jgi:hypothetical protein
MNIAEFANSECFTTEFMNLADWPIDPSSSFELKVEHK